MTEFIEFSVPFRFIECDACHDLHFPTDGTCPECGATYELVPDEDVNFRRRVTASSRGLLAAPAIVGVEVSPVALERELATVIDNLPRVVQEVANATPSAGEMLAQEVRRYIQVRANASATNPDSSVFRSWSALLEDIDTTREILEHFLDFLEAESPAEASVRLESMEASSRRLSVSPHISEIAAQFLTPEQAEAAAAAWLRNNGFDARTTGRGADEGVDVTAPGVVAQVKNWNKPVGRPEIQRLHGVATQREAVAMFFARSGYTQQAIEFANDVGMALLVLRGENSVEPANQIGRFIAAPSKVGSGTGKHQISLHPHGDDVRADVQRKFSDSGGYPALMAALMVFGVILVLIRFIFDLSSVFMWIGFGSIAGGFLMSANPRS